MMTLVYMKYYVPSTTYPIHGIYLFTLAKRTLFLASETRSKTGSTFVYTCYEAILLKLGF